MQKKKKKGWPRCYTVAHCAVRVLTNNQASAGVTMQEMESKLLSSGGWQVVYIYAEGMLILRFHL